MIRLKPRYRVPSALAGLAAAVGLLVYSCLHPDFQATHDLNFLCAAAMLLYPWLLRGSEPRISGRILKWVPLIVSTLPFLFWWLTDPHPAPAMPLMTSSSELVRFPQILNDLDHAWIAYRHSQAIGWSLALLAVFMHELLSQLLSDRDLLQTPTGE
ncbi:MAG TPA: hypothetical protein VFM16_07605 [Holophagaceae bacterium]|nr:hypothetical protein [Holophagaceae bacterium]